MRTEAIKLPVRQFSKKVTSAAIKMVAAYRELIDDPTAIKKWGHYGEYSHCRMCKAVGFTDDDDYQPKCNKCPLGLENSYAGSHDCSSIESFETMLDVVEDYSRRDYLDKIDRRMIRTAAMARLRYLLKRFKSKGIVIPDAKETK